MSGRAIGLPGPCPCELSHHPISHGVSAMADRVLVTGGLGYLGSVLCEHLLDAGYRVAALDNLMYGTGQQGPYHLCASAAFDFIKGDVRDEDTMRAALQNSDII